MITVLSWRQKNCLTLKGIYCSQIGCPKRIKSQILSATGCISLWKVSQSRVALNWRSKRSSDKKRLNHACEVLMMNCEAASWMRKCSLSFFTSHGPQTTKKPIECRLSAKIVDALRGIFNSLFSDAENKTSHDQENRFLCHRFDFCYVALSFVTELIGMHGSRPS